MANTAMSGSVQPDDSLLQHLIRAIRAAAIYNSHAEVGPRVVLWPDKDRQWQRLIPVLSAAMPELWVALSGGEPVPLGCRGGTASLLRYSLDRDERPEAQGVVPVIYLPGIERADFRSPETFPPAYRHLYPFCLLGEFFAPKSGRDWTPVGFLSSKETAINLDVAGDNKSKQALLLHLPAVFRHSQADFRGKMVNAHTLSLLFAPDTHKAMLEWIGQGDTIAGQWGEASWQAFLAVAKDEFKIQPQQDGPLVAAGNLVEGGGVWDKVWDRFCESPHLYKAIMPVLDQVQRRTLFDQRIPSRNLAQEVELGKGLEGLGGLHVSQARTTLASLVQEHSVRAESPWADLGLAPLARAVVKLGKMLKAMQAPLPVSDWEQASQGYLAHGWKVDQAARQAIAEAHDAVSYKAVSQALQGVYKPWLAELAKQVQDLRASYPMREVSQAISLLPAAGTVVLFVDGLRADVALELADMLAAEGFPSSSSSHWAPLPTVTATAKPAFQPVAAHLGGGGLSEAFEPMLRNKGKPCGTEEFRALLNQNGLPVLGEDDLGDPNLSAWMETGTIDKQGHSAGGKLAWQVDQELRDLVAKVRQLLLYGWKAVRVVTDHGWLWLPGGLPYAPMHTHLTISKWGRCAVPKPGAKHSLVEDSWFWGNEHGVVLPPGIGVFIKNTEYSHGGLSLQECLKVHLTINNPGKTGGQLRIVEAKWANLRLRVKLDGAKPGLLVDVRAKAADAASSLLVDQQPVAVDDKGNASAFANDDRAGYQGALVVLDGAAVIAQLNLTVGEN